MAKRPVNAFGNGRAPRPKGPNPGRIPRSEPYVDPRTPKGERRTPDTPRTRHRAATVADDEEAAAFAPRELPPSPRNRVVSQAALASARARMTGTFENAVDDNNDNNDIDDAGMTEADRESLRDDGDGVNVHGEDRAEYSRADVEAIVNEALARERSKAHSGPAPADTYARLMDAEREQSTVKVRVPQTMTAAPAPPSHPAMAFMPPTQGAQAMTSKEEVALPHGALSHPSGLLAMPLRVADVDRLWDWLREDGDQGAAFLGVPITTSPVLHDRMKFLAGTAEEQGVALIRALYWKGSHFGFAMLAPILADEATALSHVYLMKAARGSLHLVLPALIALMQQAAPGKHLAVASPDKTWAKLHRQLLAPLGFVEHTMFVL